MAPKFCPFGFYSFYVNKEVAQAGGCHHCLEDKCALWESFHDDNGVTGQCSILSISESLRTMSESSGTRLPVAESGGGRLSNIIDKIKKKKTLPVKVESDEAKSEVVENKVEGPPASTPGTEMAETKGEVVTPPPPPPPPPPLDKNKDDPEDLFTPPKIPLSELPVVSKTNDSKETTT